MKMLWDLLPGGGLAGRELIMKMLWDLLPGGGLGIFTDRISGVFFGF